MLLLMVEVIKGARPDAKYLTDQLLSLIILGGATAEFLLLPPFGSSIFALFCVLTFVEFVTSVTLKLRRGRIAVAATAPPRAEPQPQAETPPQPASGNTPEGAPQQPQP